MAFSMKEISSRNESLSSPSARPIIQTIRVTPPPEGDKSKQELFARIATLQAQRARLTNYLDERSTYLTQFAEEANAEIDPIGENAPTELDEAGARIMENIESRMQAFEESSELNKLEIEKTEKTVEEFEGQIARDRNEVLFSKNLVLIGLVVISIFNH